MSKYDRLEAILARAKAAYDSLTPDQQMHHRHLQRISLAAGNVALSWRTPPLGTLPGETLIDTAIRLVTAAAGACPCESCRREWATAREIVAATGVEPSTNLPHACPVDGTAPGCVYPTEKEKDPVKYQLLSDQRIEELAGTEALSTPFVRSMALELREHRRIHGSLGCSWLSYEGPEQPQAPRDRGIYRYDEDFGRMGRLSGTFAASASAVEKARGKTVYLGDCLGKHSDVSLDIKVDTLRLVSDDPDDVATFDRLRLTCGLDILGRIEEDES